jgi:hypothetical protein
MVVVNRLPSTGSKYLNRVRFRIVLSLFEQQSKQNSNEDETKVEQRIILNE